MSNLLEQAINCDNGDGAVKIIQDALGIETDDLTICCLPNIWPRDRKHRARIIAYWLESETLFSA